MLKFSTMQCPAESYPYTGRLKWPTKLTKRVASQVNNYECFWINRRFRFLNTMRHVGSSKWAFRAKLQIKRLTNVDKRYQFASKY